MGHGSFRRPGWLGELRGFASRPRGRFALVGEAWPRHLHRHLLSPLDRGWTLVRSPVLWAPVPRCDTAVASGAWRSLAARLLWEQEVAGSNPAAPTTLWP